jgi:hypothetical protein
MFRVKCQNMFILKETHATLLFILKENMCMVKRQNMFSWVFPLSSKGNSL